MEALLAGRPETSIENPNYIVEMIDTLSYLSDADLAVLTHKTTGLQTTMRYLPTPADVHAFLREHKAKAEQFKPAHTSYQRLEPDDPAAPWNSLRETDGERKRRVVKELLGYNPGETAPARTFTAPNAEDLALLKDLKTPPAPPSRELVKLLTDEGYFERFKTNGNE